jgi:hypothetical protein
LASRENRKPHAAAAVVVKVTVSQTAKHVKSREHM